MTIALGVRNFAECDHCCRQFIKTAAHDALRLPRSSLDLCRFCSAASIARRFVYVCDGCQAPVSISVDDPHECVNVYGYAFCLACMFGFYGSFDRSNRALTKAMSTRLRIRTRVPAPEREEQFRREKAYRKLVARLTEATYREHIDVLNPHRHALGPAGRSGSFQLDHIVPVSECFVRKVTGADCASVENLQVVPWLVNVVRNNRFSPETMIGAPVSARRRNTTTRMPARGL